MHIHVNPCLVTTALRHVWTNWSCDTVSSLWVTRDVRNRRDLLQRHHDVEPRRWGGGGCHFLMATSHYSDSPLFRHPDTFIHVCIVYACINYCVRDEPLLRRTYISCFDCYWRCFDWQKSCFDCHFRCFDELNSASETAQHEYVLWSIASTDKEAA